MIITDYQIISYNIKLTLPWHSAHQNLSYRQGFLVKLYYQPSPLMPSIMAIGECAPMVTIGTESLAQAEQFLHYICPLLRQQQLSLTLLEHYDFSPYPACRFALESAILSLLASHQHSHFYQLLLSVLKDDDSFSSQPYSVPILPNPIKVNAMLGPINHQSIINAQQAEQQGFSCLKFKMGIDIIDHEIQHIKTLLPLLSTHTRIRLDANKSWTLAETQFILTELQPFAHQIESIEEPLTHFSMSHYQQLQHNTPIDLALDESFVHLHHNLTHYPVNRLILKPTAQGGLINTLKRAQHAQQNNITVIITSSIETAYALWPITHLCAILNNQQHHGLATASWLADTLIPPPEINNGQIIL
jgi:o-succinylbenzoate synthase